MKKILNNPAHQYNPKAPYAISTHADGGFLQPQDAWDALSMREKAEMMKVAVKNGIYDLPTIRQKYNEFAEGGDTDWSYNSWKKQIAEYMGIRPDEDNTYDYEAFFRKYPEEAWRMLKGDPDAHFSDEFKTIYHPTFSSKSIGNEGSIYSGVRNPQTNPQGLVGGTWSPDYHTFTMSPDGYRGPVSMDDRKWYLENAEDDGVVLREANGSLPVYDGIPWGGVLPNIIINGSRRGRKFEDGGFTSELDWSPDSWFSKRVAKPDGTLYNDEEAAKLASHVPEYNNIEQTAKANGTWLKMSDGSIWKGDPRSWVMMQSESYKKNYSPKPWYTGQAEWPTTFDYGKGKVDTNKVTRAPYYNNQMWFSDSEDYGQTFADYQNSTGLGWRFDTPGEEDIKGHNFLSAIPKEGNYRTLESPANGRPDQWQRLPFVLEDGTINRLPESQISVDSKGRNIRADKQKVLTDDVVNWSKDLGDQGIFMQNIDDGAIIKNGEILRQPVNEFISQPGFTDKVKFIEGNTGDFDIDNPYKYANNFYDEDTSLDNNYAALGGPIFRAANQFKGGGYTSSDSIRKRIAKHEGAAMTGAKDPLSGKFLKNRSFESEDRSFYKALPESIRDKVLANQELADNLYSYSYNVGAGNFKKRVVPTLEKFYQGKAMIKDIEDSMWASGDSKLRGLRIRRAQEREGVRNALSPKVPDLVAQPVSTTVFNPYVPQAENTVIAPVMVPDEDSYITAHRLTKAEEKRQKFQERMEAINNFNRLLQMTSLDNTAVPFFMPTTGNVFLDSMIGLTKAEGGSIYIKPSHRGRLTELKERTGKTEAELYNDGNPAHKKMVVFARSARKWKHGLGGNLFSGEESHSQQVQLGPRYWADQTIYHDWQNSTIDGGTLPEVIISPTNDASWLFSTGKYVHNPRKPLADKHTRKVVSDYLSKFDDESAKEYNERISRLADVLDIRGVQFKKNNVKSGKLKGRAHYIDQSATAYIDSMEDIFAEVAHPWQYAKGNNNIEEEVGTEKYDSDSDPRGGTRYAYPDTAEGETHAFFEPVLTEWIETGKIGKSSPILNNELSRQKIKPKNRMEVGDSASSWNRQAIERRLLANPSQLPLHKRIQYGLFDYPLLDKKKHGLGGDLQ